MIADSVRAEITALRTYSYRRAGALVNRTHRLMGLQPVNLKRMHRVTKADGLLLPRSLKRRDSGLAHDGKVAVEQSNQRWCSDGFEIACDNGGVVTGIFMKDGCDREITAWRTWIGRRSPGESVRDMMIEAVEARFGSTDERQLPWNSWATTASLSGQSRRTPWPMNWASSRCTRLSTARNRKTWPRAS